MSQLEISSNIIFFEVAMVVCVFLCCVVEGGSHLVVMEGMLLPLFPVPPLTGDAQTCFKRRQLCLLCCVLRKTVRTWPSLTVKPVCM